MLRLSLLLLFTAAFASAACKTTFESYACAPEMPQQAQNQQQPEPVLEKPKFFFTPFHAAEISLAGAMVSDMASSWGCAEGNPLLRSVNGNFGIRGAMVKTSITGGAIVVAHLLQRKYPKMRKPLGIVLGVGAGGLYGVALRNRSVGCY